MLEHFVYFEKEHICINMDDVSYFVIDEFGKQLIFYMKSNRYITIHSEEDVNNFKKNVMGIK